MLRMVAINLGKGYVGRTLNAQLYGATGTPVGDVISTGFVELGGGSYILQTMIPPDFQGGILIFDADSGEQYGAASINETDVAVPLRKSDVQDAISELPEFRDILSGTKGKIVREDLADSRKLTFYDVDGETVRFVITVPHDKSGRVVS